MEVQSRVLRWHHTSYLIIISQTISRLIVIGGISEHIGEASGLVGGQLHSLAFSLHSRVSISPVAFLRALRHRQQAQTSLPHNRQARLCIVTPRPSRLCSPKGGRKGVKGHLKAKVNGEALLSSSIVFEKKGVRLRTAHTDKCECFPRVTRRFEKCGLLP